MRIVLEENDSVIQPDGQATMVIVAVTRDDGKVVRFPYTALSKTISDLIADVNAKVGSAPVSEEKKYGVESFARDTGKTITEATKTILELSGASDGKIKKEDLVKCIKLLPRIDKYAPIDMEVGGIYRVAEVPHGKIPYYEVLDDTDYHKADMVRRIPAYPEEIEFFAKRKPPIPKELGSFEEIFNCPSCQKRVVCNRLDDNKYHGRCDDCQVDIVSDTVREPVKQTV